MRIGVFCSGGDSPGMNACVRAVVRAGLQAGHEVVGIMNGYQGLLDEQFFTNADGKAEMALRSVSGWSRRGGALLGSSRSQEFRTEAGRKKAADILKRHQIDALVPIGGDGTTHGAIALSKCWDGGIITCPGTIDNDMHGTDFTIGFSTAVQTAVEAVDKIRDTAESHRRMFLVEVMGRHSGYIAVHTAIAAAAEIACVPETPTDIDGIIADLHRMHQQSKASVIAIVAEGDEEGGADKLNERLVAAGCAFKTRVVILGHLQRGGTPTHEDRVRSSMMGEAAVQALGEGKTMMMAGIVNGANALTPLSDVIAGHKPIPGYLLNLVATLAK